MDMSSDNWIEGPDLPPRLIQLRDAYYVHGLRVNSGDDRHLSQVLETVESKRQWIDGYKTSTIDRGELRQVIERKDAINKLIHYPNSLHIQRACAKPGIPSKALPLALDRAQEMNILPMVPHTDRENKSILVDEIGKTA